jgi:hypothetical protein
MSVNGGVHFVETRNAYAPGETVEALSGISAGTAGLPLFPTAGVASQAYGNKNHWRYYTLGLSLNPYSKVSFDVGWTLLGQRIEANTCMPISGTTGTTIFLGTGITAPSGCNSVVPPASTARNLVLDYQENTHSGYVNISYEPVKRVTLNVGYEITGDNGHTNWLRADNGTQVLVVGDVFGNAPFLAGNNPGGLIPCPANAPQVGTVSGAPTCAFAGPFPAQPIGPQAINWHKAHLGVAFDVAKGVQFKGLWSYYDYNAKDENPGLATLNVVAPRDFHANVGTLSLKYTF